MKLARYFHPVALFAPLWIAGCALGPDHVRSSVEAPAVWKETAATSAEVEHTIEPRRLPLAWWRIFEDSELDALEAKVVTVNQDLQRMMARVAEARALAGVNAADLWPTFSTDSGYSRTRATANQPSSAGLPRETSNYRTGFDLSYEIDFWGRARSAANAARTDAAAADTDFYVALLTMTADAARNYHQLRALDAERRMIEATLALRREAVRLQTTRNQAGLINEVDVTRARTEVASVEAELHAVIRGRARCEHALAVLCGEAPGAFTVDTWARELAPPSIPVGLPSELLERRPDISTAELQLEAARERIAVAKADFFPRISLTGSAGFASADLGKLTNGDSRVWSFGPSLHLPLFDGGRNRANLNVAEARYEQSAAGYRGAVLNAFREVEDALSDLSTLAAQSEAVERAVRSARDTAALANVRYQTGLSNYLDVVDAERAALQSDRLAAQLRGQRFTSTALLAKALGGGWARGALIVADANADK